MPAGTDPLLIVSTDALRGFVTRVAAGGRVAVDTEAASFHRYVDRVYLIQLSGDADTALVDPLAVRDLAPFRDVLHDPAVEVVFHDADYDLRILDRDYRFRARNVFDTRIAAELAGEPSVGLGALLHKYFEIRLDKRLQRADWSQRPLTSEMIAYAADDTRYLLPLRDLLERRLRDLARWEWAVEEFGQLEAIRWSPPADTDPGFLRIKGAKTLSRRSLAVLGAVWAWRETTAERLDRAPFRVLSNSAVLAVANAAPTSREDLAAIDGLPPALARRHGSDLLQAVRDGLAVPEAARPRRPRPKRRPLDPEYDRRLQRLRELRAARAEECSLAPGLLCPNGTLQSIARRAPGSAADLDEVPELRRWQREVLGEHAILESIGSD